MSTESSNESPTSITEVAANGDIILIVGPSGRKIRVSSFALKNASRCFTAMFGPNFSEGQELMGNDPKEVPMPDDDADALEVILNIIHLQNDAVPESLEPSKVFDIAVAADKFDCIVALKYASADWLKPANIDKILELGRLMAAAYLLDNPRAFSEITLQMMLQCKDPYISLADRDLGLLEFLPWQTLYLLEEQRSRMRTKLQNILLDGATAAGTDDESGCTCGWSSRHSFAYMQLLEKEQLWPSQTAGVSLSQSLGILERMKDPTITSCGWTPCHYRWHTDPTYRARRSWALEDLKKGNGLCIDCVRQSTGASKQECRIAH